MIEEKVRIESTHAPFGTKVLNEHGEPLVSNITNIEFSHRVGDVPRMRIERVNTETVIEGGVEVEIISLCPCCKKELSKQSGCKSSLSTADTTVMGDEWMTCIAAPKLKDEEA